MKTVEFPEVNCHFTAPTGHEEEVNTLPACVAEVHYSDGTKQREVISCWAFDAHELAEIARTGQVWLSVWGETIPPVCVHGIKPIESLSPAEMKPVK